MNTKHTPGPWKVWGVHQDVTTERGSRICEVGRRDVYTIEKCRQPFPEDIEASANAKLIAAAPELLAALQAAKGLLEQIMPVFGSSHTETQFADETAAEIQAAIAAATA